MMIKRKTQTRNREETLLAPGDMLELYDGEVCGADGTVLFGGSLGFEGTDETSEI